MMDDRAGPEQIFDGGPQASVGPAFARRNHADIAFAGDPARGLRDGGGGFAGTPSEPECQRRRATSERRWAKEAAVSSPWELPQGSPAKG
jgi:hypothetical protein